MSILPPARRVNLPSSPIVAALGSSSIEFGYVKSTGLNTSDVTWTTSGWLPWIGRLCPQIDIRHSHSFGFSGGTSTTMLSNIGSVIAATPRAACCIVQVSSNDAFDGAGTFAQWFATYSGNYAAICQRLVAASIVPIVVIQHARRDFTTLAERRFLALAAWIEAQLPLIVPGVIVVNPNASLTDFADTTWKALAALMNADNTHLAFEGHYRVALAIKATIDALWPVGASAYPCLARTDVWSADNPLGNLIDNGMMAGTAGSVSSATGTVADGWTINGGGTGLTVACSKATDANGVPIQRIAVSGTATGTGFISITPTLVSGSLAALAAGDNVEMIARYAVSGTMTNFNQVLCRWTPTDAGYGGVKNWRGGVVIAAEKFQTSPHTGILRTPLAPVVGAVSAASAPIFIYAETGNVTGYTVDLIGASVRRVTV